MVQVAFEDAEAYAAWADKALPTEAEWEFAARGGLEGAEFAWGDELTPSGAHRANTWQGPFPWRDFAADGFAGTCPVRSYPPNGHGLFEVCGNVWEWTADWWAAGHAHTGPAKPGCCSPANPRGPAMEASFDPAQPAIRIPRKVVKGGSLPLRTVLLPALPPGGAPRADGGHRHEPHRLPLHPARPSLT